jgi:hypothetical protein
VTTREPHRQRAGTISTRDPLWILAAGLALYAAAATAALMILRPILRELVDVASIPQLAVMARGLQRLLILFLYVPSIACILTMAALWFMAGKRRVDGAFLTWLFAGLLPFAFEHAGNSMVVFLRDRPTTPAEVILLTHAFSPGPRLAAELFDWTLGPQVFYWMSAFSLAGVIAIYCWGHAVAIASAPVTSSGISRLPDSFDKWIGIARAGVIYVVASSVVFFLSQPAIRIFLSLVG